MISNTDGLLTLPCPWGLARGALRLAPGGFRALTLLDASHDVEISALPATPERKRKGKMSVQVKIMELSSTDQDVSDEVVTYCCYEFEQGQISEFLPCLSHHKRMMMWLQYYWMAQQYLKQIKKSSKMLMHPQLTHCL